VYFDGNPPPSILQVAGAKELAVEFSSLSKTYSMPGWRIGFCAGNARLIAALTRVKSYLDYGAFTPIQVAATAALNGAQLCIEEMRARYRSRRDVLVEGLNAAGWPVKAPSASMFVWAPIPEPFRQMGSLEFSKLLLSRADVAVSPGVGFGEHGDGHIRFALVENEHRTRQALRSIKGALRAADPALGVRNPPRRKAANSS
jgi:alanine-synthesizing transaminase